MDRLKVFLKYLLCVVVLYILTKFLTWACIEKSFYKLENYEIQTDQILQVNIDNAKASNTNGVIEGTIHNNLDEKIQNKYLKIVLFSERNIELGVEYIKIDILEVNETKKFKLDFKQDNIQSFKVFLVDNK